MAEQPTKEEVIKILTEKAQTIFRTFGGGQSTYNNPVSAALSDSKPMFAAGVDIEEVVFFVIDELDKMTKEE